MAGAVCIRHGYCTSFDLASCLKVSCLLNVQRCQILIWTSTMSVVLDCWACSSDLWIRRVSHVITYSTIKAKQATCLSCSRDIVYMGQRLSKMILVTLTRTHLFFIKTKKAKRVPISILLTLKDYWYCSICWGLHRGECTCLRGTIAPTPVNDHVPRRLIPRWRKLRSMVHSVADMGLQMGLWDWEP